MSSKSARTGFYPGSFDPVTNGHVDVLEQAFRLFDRVVVAIGVHPGKAPMFTPEERAGMIRDVCAGMAAAGPKLDVVTYGDLAVAAAKRSGASAMIRGVRDGTDLDYEMQLAGMNRAMEEGIVTIFLPASASVRPITATLVRQIAAMGGDVSPFTPAPVVARLTQKFPRR